jgi:hypothetical protein
MTIHFGFFWLTINFALKNLIKQLNLVKLKILYSKKFRNAKVENNWLLRQKSTWNKNKTIATLTTKRRKEEKFKAHEYWFTCGTDIYIHIHTSKCKIYKRKMFNIPIMHVENTFYEFKFQSISHIHSHTFINLYLTNPSILL